MTDPVRFACVLRAALTLGSGLLMMLAPSALMASEPQDRAVRMQPRGPLLMELPDDFFIWDGEPRYLEPHDSRLDALGDWFIRRQRHHSRQVATLGRELDRTLSGETYLEHGNDTFVRLGAYNRYSEDGELGFKPEVRFRLDLPTVEDQLRLIIESDSDDLAPLSEQRQRGTLSPGQREDSGFTSGVLRWLRPLSERWKASADLGMQFELPAELFARARTWSDWHPGQWRLHVDQRLVWFVQEGGISRTWLGFHRDLGEHWSFRAASEVRWVNSRDGFEVGETLRFQRRFGNSHFLRYRAGILGESFDGWRTTEYFTDLSFRERLYDNWLFGEIIPSLRFRRENDFDAESTITFRIEMFFSTGGSLN